MHPVTTYQGNNTMSRIPVAIPRRPEESFVKKPPIKQSKLELLQHQYQQKILKEKEEKMIYMYQNNHRKMIEKAREDSGNRGKGMRNFFNERRQMENQGNVIPIEQHYQNRKHENSYHSSGGSASSSRTYTKHSAGRDRSKPLVPIERITDDIRSEAVPVHAPKPPFAKKPKLVRQGSKKNVIEKAKSDINEDSIKSDPELQLNLATVGDLEDEDGSGDHNTSSPDMNKLRKVRNKQLQKIHKQHRDGQSSNTSNQNSHHAKSEKLTDFQRWQLQQDKAREERLQKYENQSMAQDQSSPPERYESGSDVQVPTVVQKLKAEAVRRRKQKALMRVKHLSSDEDEEVFEAVQRDDVTENELQEKEHELMEMIQKQQEALEAMKLQRAREEAEEVKQAEMKRKRQAEQIERQRRLQEIENEKQNLYNEEMESESNMVPSFTHENSSTSMHIDNLNGTYEIKPSPPPQVFRKKPTRARVTRKANTPPPRETSPSANPAPISQYNLDNLEDDSNVDLMLATCHNCGRKFAIERLQKHTKVCQSHQKRKKYRLVKMRTQGMEHEQYAKTAATEPQSHRKSNKSNWKEKHTNFINAIRYAKKMQEVEAAGGNLADLPPPPPTENSDYVKCPWCERKFAPATAERHIPRCKDIKARPAPPKAQARRRR